MPSTALGQPSTAGWITLLHRIAALVYAAALLASCVAYSPSYPQPGDYGQAWDAAAGALADQRVSVIEESRDNGTMSGVSGGVNVNVAVRMQDNGGVQVSFDTSGDTATDPTLGDRLRSSYNARMNRAQ